MARLPGTKCLKDRAISCGLLFLDRFHCKAQRHLIAYGRRILACVEFGALYFGTGIRTAHFFLGEWVRRTVERRHNKRDWLGYPFDGQVAGDRCDLVSIKFEIARFEGDSRKFFDAQIVFTFDVPVEKF